MSRSLDASRRERWMLLLQLERFLEGPMLFLSFAWLALLVLDLTRGLTPFLQHVSDLIWALFILQFAVELAIAPDRSRFLRRRWANVIALALPALRVFRVVRVFRVARAARGLRLPRILTSLNRGMSALRKFLGRRRFGYVICLTLVVDLLGSAGMYAFERDVPDPAGLHDFGSALWWTTMMLTTMGSQYWPRTPEGRLLSVLLAVYGFAIFGYITASVASYFVGRDSESGNAGASRELRRLKAEVTELRREVEARRRGA